MIRNLKALLLAGLAVLAFSAIAASAAQASAFHSEAAETTIATTPDGSGETAHHVFDAAGATITCNEGSFHGTQAGTVAEEVTLSATYSGCSFLGINVPVNMNGCQYKFHAGSAGTGTVDVVGTNCGTSPISFEAPGCKVTVGPQNGLNSVTYHNIKPSTWEEITVEAHVTGIKYTSSGILCPKRGTFEDGNYTTGNTIVTGLKPGSSTETVNVFYE